MSKDPDATGPDRSGSHTAGPEDDGLEIRLATDRAFTAPLLDLLMQIEAERDIDISAQREAGYFRRASGDFFAVVDNADHIVGYLSGTRKNGNAGDHPIDDGATVAFIRMLVVSPSHRGHGVGYRAVQLFAQHAREVATANLLALRLDEGGDLDLRRARFERMGFRFERLVGLVKIDDLLEERAGPAQAPGLP